MAAKKLFSADLVANTLTTFGPVPTGKEWSFSVTFCNRSASVIQVRLALCATSTPTASEYYLYDISVSSSSPLTLDKLVLPAGYYVVALASAAGISFNGQGYEE